MQHPASILAGQWGRVITRAFLHADIWHLGLYSYALHQAGTLLEPECGTHNFLAVYAAGALAGTAMSSRGHLKNGTQAVGASGAIFGLSGSLLGWMVANLRAEPEGMTRAANLAGLLGLKIAVPMLVEKVFHALCVCHW